MPKLAEKELERIVQQLILSAGRPTGAQHKWEVDERTVEGSAKEIIKQLRNYYFHYPPKLDEIG